MCDTVLDDRYPVPGVVVRVNAVIHGKHPQHVVVAAQVIHDHLPREVHLPALACLAQPDDHAGGGYYDDDDSGDDAHCVILSATYPGMALHAAISTANAGAHTFLYSANAGAHTFWYSAHAGAQRSSNASHFWRISSFAFSAHPGSVPSSSKSNEAGVQSLKRSLVSGGYFSLLFCC